MEVFKGEEIYEILPHRAPVMILDKLLVDEGDSAEGVISLKGTEWFFPCHFPGNPMFPGFLLLEAMSQVLLATFIRQAELSDGQVPLMMEVKDVMMQGVARPDDTVIIRAKLLRFKYGIAKGEVVAFCNAVNDENVISSVRLGFALPGALQKQ